MEIELNTSHLERVPPSPPSPRAREAASPGDDAQFPGTEALSQAMAQIPDSRPETVHRARQLVGSVKYPPEQTIDRISNLLAIHLAEIPPTD
jgi:hypothetical protein